MLLYPYTVKIQPLLFLFIQQVCTGLCSFTSKVPSI